MTDAVTDPKSVSPPDPKDIRRRGLKNAGFGLGGILLSRLLVEIMIAFEVGEPRVAGVSVVLFPVIAAFGLTSAISGRESGWHRIPLVVVLSFVLIGFAFFVIIPAGYQLSGRH
jgi:hypothetical protein